MKDCEKNILFVQAAFCAKHFNFRRGNIAFSCHKRDIIDNYGKNIWISPLHNSSRRGKYCFSFSNTVASAGGLFNQRQKIYVKNKC